MGDESSLLQLKTMFPQVEVSKIRELLELYNGDVEFCTDALFQEASCDSPHAPSDVEKDNGTLIPNAESWMAEQLRETFPKQSIEFIEKILASCEHDFNEAAIKLFEIGGSEGGDFSFSSSGTSGSTEHFVLKKCEKSFSWLEDARADWDSIKEVRECEIFEYYESGNVKFKAIESQKDTKKMKNGKFQYEPLIIDNKQLMEFYSEDGAVKRREKEVQMKIKAHYQRMKQQEDFLRQYPGISGYATNLDTKLTHGDVLEGKGRLRFDPRRDIPNAIQKIVTDFRNLGYSVTGLRNFVNPALLGVFNSNPVLFFYFSSQGEFLEPGYFPVLCYHGTDIKNFPSIYQKGLLVPGSDTGIQVVNGSAFGKGIYLATTPSVSLGYVRPYNANEMIVCAACIGSSFVTTDTGTVLVITKSSHVLPMFIVKYSHTPPPQTNTNSNY